MAPRNGRNSTAGKDFNEHSQPAANQNDKGAAAPVSKISKAELLSAVRNALPAFGAHDFHLGEEHIVATKNQKKLLNLLDTKTIVFVKGPFGTGKTFWTCLAGLQGLVEKKFNKISLTSPAVEADEELGFLPGDKDAKMAQHVNQIIETLEDLVGKKTVQDMRDTGLIEIAPHAYNRGRTYKKTFYILDESQNASGKQLLTSLGRLGFGSTFVYMGDAKQNDRTKGTPAFVAFTERFNKAAYAGSIGEVTMDKEDVRRHPLLKLIVENGDDRPLSDEEIASAKESAPAAAAPAGEALAPIQQRQRKLRSALPENKDFPDLKP